MKITIFDGLNNKASLGKDLFAVFCEMGIDVSYLDTTLPRKKCYKWQNSIFKFYQKYFKKNGHPCLLPKISSTALKIFLETKPNIFLVIYSFVYDVSPNILATLKNKTGCKLVLYDTDSGMIFSNKNYFPHFLNHEISIFDFVFSCSKNMTDYFKLIGYSNVHYLPYGGTVQEKISAPKKTGLLFVGNPCMRRIFYLEHLSNFDLKIHGRRWEKYKNILTEKIYKKIFLTNLFGQLLHQTIRSSKIILNINHAEWKAIESGINLRFFETLSLGAFLLTDHFDELNILFEPGKDIETFRSADELVDKVSYYLNNDAEREKIARNGYAKFMAGNTWKSRLNEMISVLKGKNHA